jgi:hypothetical protein
MHLPPIPRSLAASILSALGLLALTLSGCASTPSWNVQTQGALGDGKTKDTAAFQQTLDQCAAAGGGQVVVPPGNYLLGSIVLRSNTALVLQKGATLSGSDNPDDYPITNIRWEGTWLPGHRALISADHARNISILGPGHIEGNPALGHLRNPRGPVLIEPVECSNIRLADFSTHFQRLWSIHPTYCDNLSAENLTIRSEGGNGDGIDVDSSKNIRIENCDIDTGDDSIAIKSGRGAEGYEIARPAENILISHCRLGDSIYAGVGIGSEMSGSVRNVRIEHTTFTHANTFAIYIKGRTDRGGDIRDISAEDIDVLDATGGFLRINLLTSGKPDPHPVPGDAGIPSAGVFQFINVRVHCGTLVDATAISSKKPLDGLIILDVTGDCKKGISLANTKDAEFRELHVTGYDGAFLHTANCRGIGLDGAVPYIPPPATQPATKARSRPSPP